MWWQDGGDGWELDYGAGDRDCDGDGGGDCLGAELGEVRTQNFHRVSFHNVFGSTNLNFSFQSGHLAQKMDQNGFSWSAMRLYLIIV